AAAKTRRSEQWLGRRNAGRHVRPREKHPTLRLPGVVPAGPRTRTFHFHLPTAGSGRCPVSRFRKYGKYRAPAEPPSTKSGAYDDRRRSFQILVWRGALAILEP